MFKKTDFTIIIKMIEIRGVRIFRMQFVCIPFWKCNRNENRLDTCNSATRIFQTKSLSLSSSLIYIFFYVRVIHSFIIYSSAENNTYAKKTNETKNIHPTKFDDFQREKFFVSHNAETETERARATAVECTHEQDVYVQSSKTSN